MSAFIGSSFVMCLRTATRLSRITKKNRYLLVGVKQRVELGGHLAQSVVPNACILDQTARHAYVVFTCQCVPSAGAEVEDGDPIYYP